MTRKIIQTSDGWQVWKGNKLIGVVSSEDEQLRALKHGEWVNLGSASNSREIAELLDNARLH